MTVFVVTVTYYDKGMEEHNAVWIHLYNVCPMWKALNKPMYQDMFKPSMKQINMWCLYVMCDMVLAPGARVPSVKIQSVSIDYDDTEKPDLLCRTI